MNRRIALGFAAILLGAVACAPKPNYLFVDPADGRVRVELRTTHGVFTKSEAPLPLADCGFYRLVVPGGRGLAAPPPEELWRVMSLSPDVSALEIRYGNVPQGFVQVTPASGPPPPLESGGSYTVECTGDAMGITEFRVP